MPMQFLYPRGYRQCTGSVQAVYRQCGTSVKAECNHYNQMADCKIVSFLSVDVRRRTFLVYLHQMFAYFQRPPEI